MQLLWPMSLLSLGPFRDNNQSVPGVLAGANTPPKTVLFAPPPIFPFMGDVSVPGIFF